MAEAQKYFNATGRRKTSTARASLLLGKEGMTVNGKPIEQYFAGAIREQVYSRPFKVTNMIGRFTGSIKVNGGGAESQLEAVVHAISRALMKYDDTIKAQLRKHMLLTRDPRMKESRKYGNAQKARAKKSSPKR
jgi:small subunit ribosomal protein S9